MANEFVSSFLQGKGEELEMWYFRLGEQAVQNAKLYEDVVDELGKYQNSIQQVPMKAFYYRIIKTMVDICRAGGTSRPQLRQDFIDTVQDLLEDILDLVFQNPELQKGNGRVRLAALDIMLDVTCAYSDHEHQIQFPAMIYDMICQANDEDPEFGRFYGEEAEKELIRHTYQNLKLISRGDDHDVMDWIRDVKKKLKLAFVKNFCQELETYFEKMRGQAAGGQKNAAAGGQKGRVAGGGNGSYQAFAAAGEAGKDWTRGSSGNRSRNGAGGREDRLRGGAEDGGSRTRGGAGDDGEDWSRNGIGGGREDRLRGGAGDGGSRTRGGAGDDGEDWPRNGVGGSDRLRGGAGGGGSRTRGGAGDESEDWPRNGIGVGMGDQSRNGRGDDEEDWRQDGFADDGEGRSYRDSGDREDSEQDWETEEDDREGAGWRDELERRKDVSVFSRSSPGISLIKFTAAFGAILIALLAGFLFGRRGMVPEENYQQKIRELDTLDEEVREMQLENRDLENQLKKLTDQLEAYKASAGEGENPEDSQEGTPGGMKETQESTPEGSQEQAPDRAPEGSQEQIPESTAEGTQGRAPEKTPESTSQQLPGRGEALNPSGESLSRP